MVVEDDDDNDDDEWEQDELEKSTDKASAWGVAMAERWNNTYCIKIVSSFVVLILSKSKLWPNQR